ncbi:cytochrome c oxidase, subunit II [Vibrionales bacterium SWAT-3]|nr:cytochrome c oxidase, subunit II [Vibrionales bacterium SWAT-3]
MEENEFDAWLAEQKELTIAAQQAAQDALDASLSLEELNTIGEEVYKTRCAVCHQANGEGIPGAFPAIKGSPIALGDVDVHIDTIVYGRGGTAMQAFDNQLTEKEIAAVVTYQRNAWGNDTGDVVQASDVNAYKVKQSGGAEGSADEAQSDAKEQL